MRFVSFATSSLPLLLLPLAAFAQDPATEPTLLGAGVRSRPAYDGSDAQHLEAVPVLRYYGPLLFARSTRGPLEGGAHFEFLPGLNAGVQLAYEPGRKAGESDLLDDHNLRDIDAGVAYGGHLQGDAARSPLTERRSNYYATAGLAYRF